MTVKNKPVTGVSLNTNSIELKVGKSTTLVAKIKPTDATVKDVIWTSDNTKVATVTASGKVKGIKKGTANITVKTVDGGHIAQCKVKVK